MQFDNILSLMLIAVFSTTKSMVLAVNGNDKNKDNDEDNDKEGSNNDGSKSSDDKNNKNNGVNGYSTGSIAAMCMLIASLI